MLRCIRGHEEGQGDGDETTPIHSAVQSQGSDRSAARGPHVQAIAGKHEVHPNQVSGWKRQAQAGLEEVFAGATSRRQKDHEATIHDLHAKIGELTVERDFLSRGLGR